MLLPALPRDPAAAYELAPRDLDGTYPGSTLRETALRRVRWAIKVGQAVATSGGAWEASGTARIDTKGDRDEGQN
jgi:hypothetical protein